MDQLPRLGKRVLICLLLLTCNYVVSVWRGFLFLLVLGMGYIILLQGCHTSEETKFPDISLTEFQISLTRDIMKLGSFCQFVKRFWELQKPLFKYTVLK